MDYFNITQLGSTDYQNPMASAGELHSVSDDVRLRMNPHTSGEESASFELAGPRERIHYNSSEVRAAVVTCGGLCPGLNAVIRGIVLELWYHYGCKHIEGIRYGYQGLGPDGLLPLELNPDMVSTIRSDGGTFLGSSRGAPSVSDMVTTLKRWHINHLYTIGGDGTLRGANAIYEEAKRQDFPLSVIGIPKTIDNDIPFVRRSFGFDTAVSEAAKAINVAEIEAKGMPDGIGLVKLMGRHAGFITATAALASGEANFVLVPEVEFGLEGENGLLKLLEQRLASRHHAVIVVAEGAGQGYFDDSTARDASGNAKLQDIGVYLKQRINEHFKSIGSKAGLKYIDPSYLIRSAPPIASDQLYCDRLARNAVHAAMAGKTGMLVGYWHGQMTHVPFTALEGQTRHINPQGELWFSVRENTGQPANIG